MPLHFAVWPPASQTSRCHLSLPYWSFEQLGPEHETRFDHYPSTTSLAGWPPRWLREVTRAGEKVFVKIDGAECKQLSECDAPKAFHSLWALVLPSYNTKANTRRK